MKYNIELEDHMRWAEEFNELIERLVHLSVNISNVGGKTKMRPQSNKLAKIEDELSKVRYEMENIMLVKFSDAPLYTSCRDYRESKD